MRRASGPIARENTETGDGRVIPPGAVEWADLPLPFAWLRDGDQHTDTISTAPQVGVIEAIWRDNDLIMADVMLDDGHADGAELIRRMEAGTASHGTRQGVSIDPDNWTVEIWMPTVDDDGEPEGVLVASLSGEGALAAAAGDPDPGDDPDGKELLFTDETGDVLQRMTRLRIRGATAVAVPAFSDAWIELADASEDTDEPTEGEDLSAYSVLPFVDAKLARLAAAQLPEWAPEPDVFHMPEPELGDDALVEQPDGGYAVPLTITDDRHVFAHVAKFGTCHIGYPDACITAPTSASSYEHYHRGETMCADGSKVATGPLTMNTDHAAASVTADQARDHYANTGLNWGSVRVTDGEFGIWATGTLAPHVTGEQVALLAGGGWSGDWRTIPFGTGSLELIGVLAVNTPGFTITRETLSAANIDTYPTAALAASAFVGESGRQVSLTSAGVVYRCPNCDRQHETDTVSASEMLRLVRLVELRTRHLVGSAAEHAMGRIRPPK